jgi:O-antigen/teichoic acid export membrane protein
MSRSSRADHHGPGWQPRLLAQLRRPFVRQTGVLQLGGLAALGVNFLLSIALARTLGRQEYGAYALIVSTFTTISLFKRLGQDYVATTNLAGAYARRDRAAAERALVDFNVVNVWSTLVVIPLALLLAPWLVERFYGDLALGDSLRLALLPPIWAMLLATLVIVLQCSRRLVSLTLVENGNNLGLALTGLAFALAGGGVADVFLGQAIASLLFAGSAVVLYRRMRSRDQLLPPLGRVLARSLRPGNASASELRAGLAVALDKNLVSLYALAPIIFLGSQAPTEDVALLRVAMSYLAVPLLASSGVSRLLMVKLPELRATQPRRMRRFFLQVTGTAGGISIILTLPFIVLAPWLIGLLYGPDFAPAARLVPLLALDPLLAGFGVAAGPLFRAYRRNSWAVWANLALLAVGLPLAYLATRQLALEGAALSYAVLTTALRAIAYLLCLRLVSTGPEERSNRSS